MTAGSLDQAANPVSKTYPTRVQPAANRISKHSLVPCLHSESSQQHLPDWGTQLVTLLDQRQLQNPANGPTWPWRPADRAAWLWNPTSGSFGPQNLDGDLTQIETLTVNPTFPQRLPVGHPELQVETMVMVFPCQKISIKAGKRECLLKCARIQGSHRIKNIAPKKETNKSPITDAQEM